jgi:hypothetical protein
MMRRTLSREDYEQDPYLAWNAFVDLLHMSEYEGLTSTQQTAHLALWYDSEVQNGGHLQYFDNRGISHLSQTLSALAALGASKQRLVLIDAAAIRRGSPGLTLARIFRNPFARMLQGRYAEVDSRYYDCKPELTDLLQTYLETHLSEFIELV